MQRRSTASGQPAKSRRRKTLRRNVRKAKQAPGPSASSADAKIAQLTRELDDALEQERAAAEVLKIISASPTEFRLVLEVIVESVARFCDADDVTIFELDGQDLRTAEPLTGVRSRKRSVIITRARVEVLVAVP